MGSLEGISSTRNQALAACWAYGIADTRGEGPGLRGPAAAEGPALGDYDSGPERTPRSVPVSSEDTNARSLRHFGPLTWVDTARIFELRYSRSAK